jgi:N-acetylmuramoyl-L-alanine amidase
MRSIYISAGHSNKKGRDRGAVGNGYIEGDLTAEFRNLLFKELSKLGNTPIVDGDNTILSETLTKFRNMTSSNSIVLDIHWNAATPKATGTETLIPTEYTKFEYNLAKDLSNTVSNVLGIPIRGVNGVKKESESHHGRLGWMRLNGENVLMEVCFITNEDDMKSYQKNKQKLVKNIAKVLFEYSQENNVYKVVKGDTLSKIAKNNNTTVDKLKKDNKLTSDLIKIGQIIKL